MPSTPDEQATARDHAGAEAPLAGLARNRSLLVPPALGLALSSAVLSLTIHGAYRSSVDPVLEAGAPLISCLAAAALMLATLRTGRLTKRAVSLITFISVHAAGISSLALSFFDLTGTAAPIPLALALGAVTATGSAFLGFYWLRKLRGTSSAAVALVALAALAIGEVLVLICGATEATRHIAAFACSFIQFGVVRASRAVDVPSDAFPAISEAYFGTSERRFSSRSYLAAAALGICCISIPIGMGIAFPTGIAHGLGLIPCIGVALLIALIALIGMRAIVRAPERSIATDIWLVIDILLAVGIVLLAIGETGTTAGRALSIVVSLLVRAFVWYLSVAFVSFGVRDPYFYTALAWVALHVFTIVGMALDALLATIMPGNDAVVIAFMGLWALCAAHVVLTQLLNDPNRVTAADRARAASNAQPEPRGPITQDDVRRIPLMGVLAVATEAEAPLPSATPDVHIATAVLEMGRRFGLSGREIEVLTLYALGHTQARVSEELQLSTNTVHTHIKRIYDKTDLHSRQEILDYITTYGS